MFKKNMYFALGMTLLSVVVISVLFYVVLTNIGVVFGTIEQLISILSSVIFGLFFAYLMNPVMMMQERLVRRLFRHASITERGLQKLSRAIGVITAVLVFAAVVYGLLALVLPQLIDSLRDLFSEDNIQSIYTRVSKWVTKVTRDTPIEQWVKDNDPLGKAQTWLLEKVNIFDTISTALTGAYSVARTVVNMLIGIVVATYLLISKERFISQAKKMVVAFFNERHADRIFEISRLTNKSLGGFFVGKIIDSALIGVLSYIGMLILKLPYPLVASVFVGISNIIPFFGPIFGIGLGAILILLESPIHTLYFLIFEIILQQVDGNIIGPRILGGRLGISDFWILVSITFFGGLFGFPGMILGVPVFTVIYSLVSQAVRNAVKKKNHTVETSCYYDIITVSDLERYSDDFRESTVFYSGDTFDSEYDPDSDFEYEDGSEG